MIAGLDEVGRGCLAGPVFAAGVVLDEPRLACLPEDERGLIRDSKKLTARQRERALSIIGRVVLGRAIGASSVREIERLGIQAATFLAMRRALCMLPRVELVRVDGRQVLPEVTVRQQAVVGGDAKHVEIAAASIVAKVARDSWMTAQAECYPQYGFERHVGYGTRLHLQRIREHGICILHRRNFAPIKDLCH